jgi:hypothetical protein
MKLCALYQVQCLENRLIAKPRTDSGHNKNKQNMNRRQYIILTFFALTVYNSFGQKSTKIAYYFDDPIVVDSSSTVIIPSRYNTELFSANKISLWGDFYANIIFYNFTTDSYKKLFDNDTYIVGFSNRYNSDFYNTKRQNNFTSKWLFYRVKNIDRNKSGRIDNNDPSILFVSDIHGDKLKALTTENENVVGIDIFEKQGFALLKIQRDIDNDGNFKDNDKDFYFVKLDLGTLTFGNKIETK